MHTENEFFSVWHSSRRQWMFRAISAVGTLLSCSPHGSATSDDGLSHTAEVIHQEPVFQASAKRIYAALTEAQQFQKVQLLSAAMKSVDMIAKPAVINAEPGGTFALFGDYISGRQLELLRDKRIVQAWRAASWDPGMYSIVRFALVEDGPETKIVFDHAAFPAGTGPHLAAGWKANYWEPLEKFLA
jgi:activator of HSP90 ATPase